MRRHKDALRLCEVERSVVSENYLTKGIREAHVNIKRPRPGIGPSQN